MVIMIILFHYITQCFRMIAFEAKKIFSSSGVQTSTTCVAKRNCRSSRPLGYPTRYKIELIFLVIIHANSYDCGRSRQTLGYVSFELMRVMTSTLTFQHILDVVYISLKKPSILLYSKHTKYFKNFSQDFYLLPKWKTSFFLLLSQVRDQFLTFLHCLESFSK